MSTALYLECQSHEPRLTSDEVGYHLTDLPRIRGELADRGTLIRAVAEHGASFDEHWTAAAARFMVEHPNCDIGIRDEYGREHPTEPEVDE